MAIGRPDVVCWAPNLVAAGAAWHHVWWDCLHLEAAFVHAALGVLHVANVEQHQVAVGLVVVAPTIVVVVHQPLHFLQMFASCDLDSFVHLDPAVIPVIAVIVDERLLDAVVSICPVAACSTPPFRGMTE